MFYPAHFEPFLVVQFDRSFHYVRRGKNYKERFVPINKYNLSILEEYLYDARSEFIKKYQTDALLLSIRGRRINDLTLAGRLKEIIKASENDTITNKRITPHTLRHSIATHLLQNKVSIQSISQFLGHASLESTQIYTHLVEQEQEQNKATNLI